MTHEQAMFAVLNGTKEPIPAKVFFERTMRLLGETGDPAQISRDCGIEPDQLVSKSDFFNPQLKSIE